MRAILILAAVAGTAWGQYWYPRNTVSFGLGAGQPRADLAGPFEDSVGLTVAYGRRFHRYLQADVGLDTLFSAGRVRDYLPTASFGDLRIRDYQFLVPAGLRAILPIDRGRLLVSAGGGGVYLRYTELLRQPGDDFRIDCTVCNSRHGLGYYGLLGVSVAVDRHRHYRIGVTSKVYQGHTDGDPLGLVPALRTRDRWVNVFGELGLSF